MRVLVAEDDPVSRALTVRAVEQLGYACDAAQDGLDAWGRFLAEPPDVLISDWLMPGLDGVELCRRIRARGDRRYTYVILLTARGERESRLTGMHAGADDYLAKPLDPHELQLRLIAAQRVTRLHRTLEEQARELERLTREYFELGRRDPLTGLANRRRLQEDLIALDGRAAEGPAGVVALFDIDHFKRYNDTHLHLAGDDALRLVARRLAAGIGARGTVYRFGGEEFLVLLPDLELAQAAPLIEGLRVAIEAEAIPHGDNPDGPVLTVSAGLAARGETFLDGLRAADEALLEAKRTGRNRVVGPG